MLLCRYLFVWVAFLGVLVVSSHAVTGEEDFFPFYFNRTILEPDEVLVDEDIAFPFGRYKQEDDFWYGAIRPFLSWGGDLADKRFLRILPPFGLFNWSDTEVDYRFLPFWYYRVSALEDGTLRKDIRFIPFYFYKSDNQPDPSQSWFLFYGHLYNRWGVDESEYWMFPLLMRTRRANFYNWSFLWPFFGYGYGGGGSNYRIWPFYGHKIVPGQKDAMFVLWPLYGHQIALDEEGDSVETWGCFPLYVRIDSPRRSGWSFLWPFFTRSVVNRPRRTLDELRTPLFRRTNEVRRDAEGNDVGGEETYVAFPLYGDIHKRTRTSHLDAKYRTIFYWEVEKGREGKFEYAERIVFPFWWARSTYWTSTGIENQQIKLWPLFNFQGQEDGGSHLRVFDPFWFRLGKDLERHYSFLYTLYERERDKEGYGYDQFLGKTIYRANYKDYSRTNILHLIQTFDTPEDGRGWSLLRGLVGRAEVNDQAGQRTRWRLLWIPFEN